MKKPIERASTIPEEFVIEFSGDCVIYFLIVVKGMHNGVNRNNQKTIPLRDSAASSAGDLFVIVSVIP